VKLTEAFKNKFVEIMLTTSISITETSEEGYSQKSKPLVSTGYFVDEDEHYVYLGVSPSEVMSALKKEHIVEITISKPYDKYDAALDRFEDESVEN
jgi:hypothetical protein